MLPPGNGLRNRIPRSTKTTCRSELAPGGVPTMDFNDDAGRLNARVAQSFIASRLAPTEKHSSARHPLFTTHQAER
ncbi:hypothetical protein ACVWYU_003824 [Pseudomonas sp. TE12234]